MASWRLAKGLAKLRQQVNDKWPNRSKISDGTIGDTAHSARASDHNPDSRGIVCAFDCTHDPTGGPDGHALSLALTHDSRVKYVIFAGRIWKARTGQWEAYRGPNSHHHHVHVSIKPEVADDERVWMLDAAVPPVSYPTLKRGARGQAVRDLQQRLTRWSFLQDDEVDGIFGQRTQQALEQFQWNNDLKMDGIAGPNVWAKFAELG